LADHLSITEGAGPKKLWAKEISSNLFGQGVTWITEGGVPIAKEVGAAYADTDYGMPALFARKDVSEALAADDQWGPAQIGENHGVLVEVVNAVLASILGTVVVADESHINQHVPWLISAAYSATQQQQSEENKYGCGLLWFVNVTAIGTSTWTPKVEVLDTASASWSQIFSAAAISSTGMKKYLIYPGLPFEWIAAPPSDFTAVMPLPLSRNWRCTLTYGGTGTGTLSSSQVLLRR
jgi:hypothetical protein